jgi:SAM-dependent methyltransferase
MIDDTLPPQDVLRLYDRLGPRYDWFAALESRAKALAFEHLDLAPGMHVLDIGVGTGREHLLIQEKIAPDGAGLRPGPVEGDAQAVPPAQRSAGYRPLRLSQLVDEARMDIAYQAVITQLGLPGEIIAARKAQDGGSLPG